MASRKQVVAPKLEPAQNAVLNKTIKVDDTNNIIVNFSSLKLTPICLSGKFNNHFKNEKHFGEVAASFLGQILPKINSHTYNEICESGPEGHIVHFHTIDESHRKIVRKILEAYHYPDYKINQMFEGNDIVEFAASMGHVYPARVVGHKVKNVLHLLFLDTNHHIYMDEKYVKDTFFYQDCPAYLDDRCPYMPTDCFAVSYLNGEQIRESLGYSFSP